jgi:pyrrolidone-carboxylate peptidase
VYIVAILGLGQTCQEGVEIERIAHNKRDSPPADENGVEKQDEAIEPNGPAQRETAFSQDDLEKFKKAVENVKDESITARIDTSVGPGTFLCNEAYYTSLGIMPKSLFVHLEPYPTENADRSDPENAKKLNRMNLAVNAILDAMTAILRDDP